MIVTGRPAYSSGKALSGARAKGAAVKRSSRGRLIPTASASASYAINGTGSARTDANYHLKDSAIMGVFDEGCMGMYNAIFDDEYINPMGIYKERLSQSALYYRMTTVTDEEAEAIFDWLVARGVTFDFGSDEETELTKAQVITDRDTGRSRGFGFVEMASADEANEAMRALNGRNVDGRDLTVNQAKERS